MTSPTDIERERLLNEKGLAFFGAITASVTHELNNVMSIVEQTSGLLEDLLYGASEGRPIPNEKLEKIAEGINAQCSRGVGLIGRLNKFAHTTDASDQSYELNAMAENIAGLCRRFANLKGAQLETKLAETDINLAGNPFIIQQIVFVLLKGALTAAQKGDVIELSSGVNDAGAFVSLSAPVEDDVAVYDRQLVTMLIQESGCEIEQIADNGNCKYRIVIQQSGAKPKQG